MNFPSGKVFWLLLAAVALPATAVCTGFVGNAPPTSPAPGVRPVARIAKAHPTSLLVAPVTSSLPPITPRRSQPMTFAVEVVESGQGGTWKQVEVEVTAVPEPSAPLLVVPAAFLLLRRRRPAR